MKDFKTSRKNFIKASALVGLGTFAFGIEAKGNNKPTRENQASDILPINGKFELAPLPYPANALEPFIDTQTMEIHHGKHHQAYVNKLNDALVLMPSLQNKSLENLLVNISDLPENIRNTVRNHGGGHWNHTFFWKSLKVGTKMGPKFTDLASKSFGSIEQCKANFEKLSLGIFGSGWAWLIVQDGQLKMVTSANQDNPLMDAGKEPKRMPKVILGIDVWEHAYYLKHKNKRADYVSSFWNVVNWDEIETLL
ncbi:MAG: superoxide dismutase [Sphingobacteriales bacterium]|nr:superoxide dismutase [Sphingobacteriales bacterium]